MNTQIRRDSLPRFALTKVSTPTKERGQPQRSVRVPSWRPRNIGHGPRDVGRSSSAALRIRPADPWRGPNAAARLRLGVAAARKRSACRRPRTPGSGQLTRKQFLRARWRASRLSSSGIPAPEGIASPRTITMRKYDQWADLNGDPIFARHLALRCDPQ
jgi:hypothetical protein